MYLVSIYLCQVFNNEEKRTMNLLNIEKMYHKFKFLIPENLLYSSDYFKLKSLLQKYDQGDLTDNYLDELLKDHLIYCIRFVPYYREAINLKENELSNLSGKDLLSLFPFITKEDVNQSPSKFISTKYNDNKLMHSSSGGSSGVGIQVWYNKSFTDIERAFFDHEWGKFNFNFRTSRILRFGSDALKQADEPPCEVIGRKLTCSPYHFNEKWLPIIVEKADEFNPECLHGYPSLVFEYLKYLKENQLQLPKSLKSCLLASEPLLDYQLKMVQEFFGDKFSVNYGLTERNVIGFSQMKNNVLSYNLSPLYAYTENYKTEVGDEIVGTSLWNKVMPLVRYRTKDYGKIIGNKISNLEGRSQDFLITRDGESIPGMTVAIDKFIWNYFNDIQIVQSEKGQISFSMVPKENQMTLQNEVIDKFLISQNKKWGCFFDISIEVVDFIELTSSGKKRLIISHL